MNVIIAVVPAPGHEDLIAEVMGERPARMVQNEDGHWLIDTFPDTGSSAVCRALVLHAPGGPLLGMVRLRATLGLPNGHDIDLVGSKPESGPAIFRAVHSDPDGRDVAVYDLPSEPPEGVAPWGLAGRAYALAHLAHQRGIVAEVLVLEVPRG